MKYIIKYYTPVFFAVLFFSCSKNIYKSAWQPQPTQINGNVKEQAPPFKNYDKESDLYYTISNDLDHLYIAFKTNNKQTQMNILRSGIELSMDTTGKYGERAKIIFPYVIKQKVRGNTADGKYGANANVTPKNDQGFENSENLDTLKKKFIEGKKMMHLFGFKYPIQGAVSLPNEYDIKMNISWDSTNTMFFNASIPFVTFYKPSLTATDSSKIIAVSIKITGQQSVQTNGGMVGNGFSFGMGGMGIGFGMGAMGMGGMGFGMDNMGGMGGMGRSGFGMRMPVGGYGNNYGNSSYPVDNLIKMKIKLAVNPSQKIENFH